MKRMTDSEKWSDPWFRKLSPPLKLGYLYLLDRVDNCGVISLDEELANFQIGMEIDWGLLSAQMGERLAILPNGKWHLTRFVRFQCGELNPECKPHLQVIRLQELHGINTLSKGYAKGIHTPKDKDKDKEEEKEEERARGKPPLQIRVEKLMRRRESTPLNPKEVKTYKAALPAIEATTEEQWSKLEKFYSAPQEKTFSRKDLISLLNNWNGEIDKAEAWAKQGPAFASTPVTGLKFV